MKPIIDLTNPLFSLICRTVTRCHSVLLHSCVAWDLHMRNNLLRRTFSGSMKIPESSASTQDQGFDSLLLTYSISAVIMANLNICT